MKKFRIGPLAEFAEGSRKVVSCDDVEIGVFMIRGQLTAWLNSCPHMGGPVCTGRIYKRVLEPLGADQTTSIQQHSETDIHVVCPWHGYEFDLVTGAHPGGSRRLRKIELEVSDGNVHALF